MSIDILKEDIRNKCIRSLYLFYGPEEYLKKYYIEAIDKLILDEGMKQLNKIVLEGKLEANDIIQASETMPVFSDRKLVIVKNASLLKPRKKSVEEGKKGKDKDDELFSYLNGVPAHTCLIFSENEVDKRMRIIDSIKKKGLIVEFQYQKPPELVKWVIKGFKSYKKEIDSMTAAQMVDLSEPGMNEILNEIHKVVSFVGDRTKVTGRDIDEVCTKSVKSRIFDLTDAISENNGAKALKLLNDMVILKEPLPKILFMITRQFRHVLEMKLLTEKGTGMNEAAKEMGITPFAASRIMKQVNRFTIESLKAAVKESLDMDVAIKSGKINDRIAAELLISKYSTL